MIFIATPVYKEANPKHREAAEATLRHFKGAAIYAKLRGDSCLARARATLFAHYLASGEGYTHYLQCDDDITWSSQLLERLMGLPYPIIGGLYAYKSKDPLYRGLGVYRPLDGPWDVADDGTAPCRYCGGGFILFRAKVLRDLCEAHPELRFRTPPDGNNANLTTWNFWSGGLIERPDWGEGAREFLTEDYWVCELARRIGYECRLYVVEAVLHWDGANPYAPAGYELRHEGEAA